MATPTLKPLMSPPEAADFATFSRSTMYAEVRAGRFPAPVTISPGRTAFRGADLAQWAGTRPVASAVQAEARPVVGDGDAK
jgi:predicted DNA-binding transcriptional regulator AlpA